MGAVPRSYWDERARKIAAEEGVDPDLYTNLIRAESGGNPNARSKAGAIGLAQLMPKTAMGLGVNPHNPDENLRGGARYLKQQMNEFKDPALALAAYNAGPTRVRKAGGIPNIKETMDYVNKIVGRITQPKPTGAIDMNKYPAPADVTGGLPFSIGNTQGNTSFNLGFDPQAIKVNAPRFVDPNIPQSSWQQTAGKGEGIPPRPTITPDMKWIPKGAPAGAGIGVGVKAAAAGGGLALPLLAAAAGVSAAGYQGYKAATGQKPIGEDFVLNAIKDWAPHAGLGPDYPYTDNEGAPVSSAIPTATRNKGELDTANMQGVEPAWAQSHELAPEQEPAKPAFVEGPNLLAPPQRGVQEVNPEELPPYEARVRPVFPNARLEALAGGRPMPEKIPGVNWSQATQSYYPGFLEEHFNPEPILPPDMYRVDEKTGGLIPTRTADRRYQLPEVVPGAEPVELIKGNQVSLVDQPGGRKATPEERAVVERENRTARENDTFYLAKDLIERSMNEPSTVGKHTKYGKDGEVAEEYPIVNPNAGRGAYAGATLMGGLGTSQRAEEANELKAELARMGIEKAEAARMGQDVKILATRPQWNEDKQGYDQIFDPSRVGPAYKLLKAMQSGRQEEIDFALKEYHGGGQQPPAGFKATGKMRNGKPEYFDDKTKRYWTE